MDRLPLYKALADESRYAIFAELQAADGSLSVGELADRLTLHPNTVRLHLERLREVGLVDASRGGHGGVGRPERRWAVTAAAPDLGLRPDGSRTLAGLLAEVIAAGGPDLEALLEVGRRTGRRRSGAAAAGTTHGEPAGAGADRSHAEAGCLRRVVDELADLGFDPVAAGGVVAFTSCPFRELAVLYPDLVCTLHRGVTEGIVEAAAARAGVSAEVAGFSTLVDTDPCRAELAVRG